MFLSSANKHNFWHLSYLYPFSFLLLPYFSKNSVSVLNDIEESGQLYLAPDCRENGLSFSSPSTVLAIASSYIVFIMFLLFLFSSELLSWRDIEFCQMFFLCLLRWSVSFVLYSVCVVYYIYWFAHVEPALCPWNEANLIMVYDLFKVLLNLVCKYFSDSFCIYVHAETWSFLFLFVMSLSSFGIRVILTS
jgi:hypothetical protein